MMPEASHKHCPANKGKVKRLADNEILSASLFKIQFLIWKLEIVAQGKLHNAGSALNAGQVAEGRQRQAAFVRI